MSTIVTRYGKGSPLTWLEVDNNFTNLNTDKIQSGDTVAALTITSATINGGSINGTTIGAGTAAAITGTNLTYTGTLTGSTGILNIGSGQIYKDASGNVGIGTSSPSSILNIYNSTSSVITLQGNATVAIENQRYSTNATGGYYMIRKARGTVASPSAVASSDVAGEYLFGVYGGTTNRTVGRIRTTVDTYTSDTDISSYMSFYTNNSGTISPTEKMRIDSSGNVGIGATPSVKFHIQQDQAAYSYFDYYNVTASGGIVWRQIHRNLANTTTSSVDLAWLTSGGFVINNNDTGAANFTAFGIGGSERMRIHASGGVSIGNTTDSGAGSLNVNGSLNGGYIAHAAGTTAMAFGADNVVRVTPNATATYTTTVPAAGAICVLSILTSGTTSYTITFGTGFKSTGTLATGTVSARYFNITFVSDGTNLIEMSRTVAIA